MVSFSLCSIFRPPYGSAHKCVERATISATVPTWNIGFGVYVQLLHEKNSINTWWKKRQMATKKFLQSLQFFHILAKVAQREDATNTEANVFWICPDIALPDSACSFMHKADVPPLTITHLCKHSGSYTYTSSDRETSEKAEKCHPVLLAAMNYECCLSA